MTIAHSYANIWRTSHTLGKTGPDIPGLRQIYAGAAADEAAITAMTDIAPTGERKNNLFYSEMSAMWRIWKHGPTSDIIGWCQYRRYFWFGSNPVYYDGFFAGIEQQQFNNLLSNFIPQNLHQLANKQTITVCRAFDLGCSVYEYYAKVHNAQDYLSYFCQIAMDYPHLAPFMADQFRSHQLYGCDMFICTWETFDEICNLWFSSLDKWIAGRTRLYDDSYQNRAPSFLSERIFTAWINWKKSQGWQVNELPVMLLTDI